MNKMLKFLYCILIKKYGQFIINDGFLGIKYSNYNREFKEYIIYLNNYYSIDKMIHKLYGKGKLSK